MRNRKHMVIALTLIYCLGALGRCKGRNGENIKGMFVFGSSLVDNGNNNYVRNSSTRADYLPYGIDFLLGPSGRFSNGRNPIDVLGELLKLPGFLPPFTDPTTKGKKIVHGVNYASGGSGILDQTGPVTGGVISLNQQIWNFQKITIPDLRLQLGHTHRQLSSHLSKSLFVLGTGGNDYLLNYFSSTGANHQMSLQDFTNTLIASFSKQLKWLYGLGGRKFVVLSVQVMGCIPTVRESIGNGSCFEPFNEAALLFNQRLKLLVDDIKTQMPASNLVFVNSYKIIKDIIDNPISKGFKETRKACCERSSNKTSGGVMCERGGRTCGDRASYVFFDGLHPTDAVNKWIAKKAYGSNRKSEVYPINVKQLVCL
ncbi:GDSL esterase/lipase At1g29670-like [Magnolia sinica]|uniref:GDSL esterase/lipase At1g29670-like n=1 Tax=Magnolia sinica TaxID=86752 RepID=UPI002659F899|nr:GDSL esterase/lipase At1g29670-like [Magnolia sinica]